jgi:FADH2-dependent halogenase
LLTYTADVLDQLGVLDRMCEAGFVVKRGIELSGNKGTFRRLQLGKVGEGLRGWTLHVERSEFDKILLDAAAETPGVTVRQKARVTRLLNSGERIAGVRYDYDGAEHERSARFVIDASGRAGVIARGLDLRKADDHLKMAAVFKHLGGLDESKNPGTEGDIQLGLHAGGWVWAIPIRPDVADPDDRRPVRQRGVHRALLAGQLSGNTVKVAPAAPAAGATTCSWATEALSGPIRQELAWWRR